MDIAIASVKTEYASQFRGCLSKITLDPKYFLINSLPFFLKQHLYYRFPMLITIPHQGSGLWYEVLAAIPCCMVNYLAIDESS